MTNPDFVMLAKAMGVHAIRVNNASELPAKMKEFLEYDSSRPILMECVVETNEHVFPMVSGLYDERRLYILRSKTAHRSLQAKLCTSKSCTHLSHQNRRRRLWPASVFLVSGCAISSSLSHTYGTIHSSTAFLSFSVARLYFLLTWEKTLVRGEL